MLLQVFDSLFMFILYAQEITLIINDDLSRIFPKMKLSILLFHPLPNRYIIYLDFINRIIYSNLKLFKGVYIKFLN